MSNPSQENYQPPPPPPPTEGEPEEGPVMSTGETLLNIFFEPAETFEALRRKPRFLAAALITLAAFSIFYYGYFAKIGYENIITAEIGVASQTRDLTPEQREQSISIQQNTLFKAFRYVIPIVNLAVFFAIGSALYLLGASLVGRAFNYIQALSVWSYSSYPPMLFSMLLNIVILFIRTPESDAEIVRGQGGLVHANLSLLVNTETSPVLGTFLAAFDVFAFYGLFLAAIGLQKMAKLSTGSAWGVVLAIWVIGLLVRVAMSLAFGRVIG